MKHWNGKEWEEPDFKLEYGPSTIDNFFDIGSSGIDELGDMLDSDETERLRHLVAVEGDVPQAHKTQPVNEIQENSQKPAAEDKSQTSTVQSQPERVIDSAPVNVPDDSVPLHHAVTKDTPLNSTRIRVKTQTPVAPKPAPTHETAGSQTQKHHMTTQESLTLDEALAAGMVRHCGKFVDAKELQMQLQKDLDSQKDEIIRNLFA